MDKAKKLIISYLHNPVDYQLGFEIYCLFGDNSFYKMILEEETSQNKKLLIELLESILKSNLSVEIPGNEFKQVFKRPSEQEDAPDFIQQIVKVRNENFHRAKELFSKLQNGLEDSDLRRLHSLEILRLFKENENNWYQTTYFDQHKKIAEKVQGHDFNFDNFNEKELNKFWETNYKYIKKFQLIDSKKDEVDRRKRENQEIKKKLGENFFFAKYEIT